LEGVLGMSKCRCKKKFDLYSDMCLDCGESDHTIKLYEACRKKYLRDNTRNQDTKIINTDEKGIGGVGING
jgi:hypothetical protein